MSGEAAPNVVACRGSSGSSAGVHIVVTPSFTGVVCGRYEFQYHVRISNLLAEPVTILRRRWRVIDADGHLLEVRGDGLVGQVPTLAPRGAGAAAEFEYVSTCPLETQWGTMEGSYTVRAASGELFDALIPRFYLVSPARGDRVAPMVTASRSRS
jgi:ApaG protein